jgi:hypothetical protein
VSPAERQKQKRADNEIAGLCKECGSERDGEGKYCADCQSRSSKRRREWRERRRNTQSPRDRVLMLLSNGPLSLAELQAKVRRASDGDLPLVLRRLVAEGRIKLLPLGFYKICENVSTDSLTQKRSGVESKQSGRAASLPN